MSKLHELTKLGQSVWFDFIRRSILENGELKNLVELGVRGVTSNPTIFDKAISGSADYDNVFKKLIALKKTPDEIYETIVIEDISKAADILLPIYRKSNGDDGYVSLEVRPTLASNTKGTIAEAMRLFKAVGRPNLMIKVPATPAGIPAVTELISKGISVNVTLLFSLKQYKAVTEAYINGMELLLKQNRDLRSVASVASFFVSRVDTVLDKTFEEKGRKDFAGKIAIDNSKIVYSEFLKIFSGPRWEKLASKGARLQRPLWASTGTKNPSYPDTLYVDTLIGQNTVNTVPPATLDAFMDHGTAASTILNGIEESEKRINALPSLGIDLDAVTQKLQDDGVGLFTKSFESLMSSIAKKKQSLES